MTCKNLVAVMQEAITLGIADEWQGQEPKLDLWVRFIVHSIHLKIPRFWEQNPVLVTVALEKADFRYVPRLLATEPLALGFAIRELNREIEHSHEDANLIEPEDTGKDQWGGDWIVPEGLWARFIFDEQLAHPNFARYKASRLFRSLVEDHVPAALFERWEEAVTLETIVWAQHIALREYQRIVKPKPGSGLAKLIENKLCATRSFDDKDMFLTVWNTTEEAWCAQLPGLWPDEYAAMKQGRLTLADLYYHRPAFIMRPLLPGRRAVN